MPAGGEGIEEFQNVDSPIGLLEKRIFFRFLEKTVVFFSTFWLSLFFPPLAWDFLVARSPALTGGFQIFVTAPVFVV